MNGNLDVLLTTSAWSFIWANSLFGRERTQIGMLYVCVNGTKFILFDDGAIYIYKPKWKQIQGMLY